MCYKLSVCLKHLVMDKTKHLLTVLSNIQSQKVDAESLLPLIAC